MASTYDPYGLELSGIDPEQSAELRKLKRQQDITDLLMQRGMESPQGKMVGDVYVKPSWTQGVSQLVNAYLSGQSQKGVDAGYQGIADKQKADEVARLEAMNKTMTGTPEIAPVMAPSMAMNPNPDGSLQQVVANNPQAAVPGDPRKAVEDYLMSRSPLMGALQRAKGLEADQAREENIAARKDTTQATLEQRKWELEQRLLDARISAADKLDAQKQLIRLTASLRQPATQKAAKDFVWNADGTEQRVIPGSQTDLKMKAAKTKDARNKVLLDSTLDAEISNIDKLIGNEEKKIPEHPGLNASVGVIASRIPTLRQNTADAEALEESLRSKASISSLQTIRGTAGAIGTLTEREWPRLESMKATLQASQGTPQFRQSLKDYRDELIRIKRIGLESVDDTSSGAPSAPSAPSDIDALLEKYK